MRKKNFERRKTPRNGFFQKANVFRTDVDRAALAPRRERRDMHRMPHLCTTSSSKIAAAGPPRRGFGGPSPKIGTPRCAEFIVKTVCLEADSNMSKKSGSESRCFSVESRAGGAGTRTGTPGPSRTLAPVHNSKLLFLGAALKCRACAQKRSVHLCEKHVPSETGSKHMCFFIESRAEPQIAAE